MDPMSSSLFLLSLSLIISSIRILHRITLIFSLLFLDILECIFIDIEEIKSRNYSILKMAEPLQALITKSSNDQSNHYPMVFIFYSFLILEQQEPLQQLMTLYFFIIFLYKSIIFYSNSYLFTKIHIKSNNSMIIFPSHILHTDAVF